MEMGPQFPLPQVPQIRDYGRPMEEESLGTSEVRTVGSTENYRLPLLVPRNKRADNPIPLKATSNSWAQNGRHV